MFRRRAGRVRGISEAAIVFARAALHRFQAKDKRHAKFKAWWDSLLVNPSIDFIRTERNWLLKEAPPKINQVVFAATISVAGDHAPAYGPAKAGEFYYFEAPGVPATCTVAKHLGVVSGLLSEGERLFG